jgi:serine/threonine protein kinase
MKYFVFHFVLLSTCSNFAQMNDNSMSNHIDEAVSGAVAPSFEGVSPQFTHRQLVATRRSTMLWKAKRYGRWFMLKALKPDCAADVAHQQLLIKEFNTLMAIQHPGVVNCYGMETVDGAGMCIVMEYVEGESLKQWLAAEHSLHESERVLGQLLDAVAAIHQAGIVHRDLKPENVMIAHLGGQVKIIDFGLADADDYALFKQPAGTQGYASEEQSQGGVPDVRNDIYSLGVIMEQMPGIARRYGGVVKRCQLDIAHRYENVEQLRAAMRTAAKRRKLWHMVAVAIPVVAAMAIAVMALLPKPAVAPPAVVVAPSVPDTSQTVTAAPPAEAIPSTPAEAIPSMPAEAIPSTPAVAPVSDRTRAVEQAKIAGERLLRSKFPSPRLSHWLDTLSSREYETPEDWEMFQDGHRIVNKYIDDNKGRFSSTELTDIYSHLGIVNAQIIQELYDKHNKKFGN